MNTTSAPAPEVDVSGVEPVARSRVARFVSRGWWLPAAAGVLAIALFLMVKESLTDDAYITLTYAKNLATNGTWGIIPGEPVNSATSPLNVLLLAGLTLLTRVFGEPHPVLALGALNVLSSIAIGWGWLRLARSLRIPMWVAACGTALVLLNPILLSAVGLEVLLIPAVLIWLVVLAIEERPLWFGSLSGAASLVRPDLVLFVLVIAFSAHAIRRRIGRAVLAAVVVGAPWYLFSWFYFGSAVPDTLVIKQLQADSVWGPWGFFNGPIMYFLDELNRNFLNGGTIVLLAFIPALLGVGALLGWAGLRFGNRWSQFPALAPLVALGAGGVIYYVVYSLLGPGPFHWYYVAPTVSLGMFLVAFLGVWLHYAREYDSMRIVAPRSALALVMLVMIGTGAAMVSHGIPWKSPMLFTNWARADDYARVAKALSERLNDDATVASPGEIGTLAYFCDCNMVDMFSDRGRMDELVVERIEGAGPIGSFLLRLNYLWFDYTQQPIPLDYKLVYGNGPGSGPNTWQVYGARGVGHFTLIPVE